MRKNTNGILLVNKEKGVTSRRVGNMLSRKFNIKKVGHLGTLDPFATGLLIFALNEGTKTLPFLEDETKTYIATFKLGLLTSTLDPDGEIISEEEVSLKKVHDIKLALSKFVGKIKQTPPLTSAIHVAGKRLYEYAREGKEVIIPEREVEVFSLRLLDYIHPFFQVEAIVSKGTYIRTLGADIGRLLGENVTTVELERTTHGSFLLQNAKSFDEVTLEDIIPVSKTLHMFPIFKVNDTDVLRLKNGQTINVMSDAPIIQAVDEYGSLIALCRQNGAEYTPFRGFNL